MTSRCCDGFSQSNVWFVVRYISQTMKRKRKSHYASHVEKNQEPEGSSTSIAGEEEGNSVEESSSPKTKKFKTREARTEDATVCQNPFHVFTDPKDVHQFRENLLQWYDANKRDLPWRKWASHPDRNQRVYAVWVSEIMLQQTQVATVIDYYNRWMTKWPTLEDLAFSATPEEVNEMWSGLGYYSRGRRLHEGARKVMEVMSGVMPSNAESLMKQLPGVGRYTAGAIASIAFKEPTGVVDGNVIRVLSRARAIGADSTSPTVQAAIWSLANALVDRERPGDFNQALMELGATICTPKAPSCDKCPIKSLCRALQYEEQVRKVKKEESKKEFTRTGPAKLHVLPDIECAADGCQLCIPAGDEWDVDQGVMNFPRKPKKKPPRQEQTAVCVVQKICQDKSPPEYLLVQRPETGLLAGLWEFPSVKIEGQWSVMDRKEAIDTYISDELRIGIAEKNNRHSFGQVIHIFSHIEQTYHIETFTVHDKDVSEQHTSEKTRPHRWLTAEDFWTGAISTAMKKCFSAYIKSVNPAKVNPKKIKFDSNSKGDGKRQSALDAFFKPIQKRK